MNTNGHHDKIVVKSDPLPAEPAQMMAVAPRQGKRAFMPGKGVSSLKTVTAHAIAESPKSAVISLSQGLDKGVGGRSASKTPMSSSQALVGRRKKFAVLATRVA